MPLARDSILAASYRLRIHSISVSPAVNSSPLPRRVAMAVKMSKSLRASNTGSTSFFIATIWLCA